MADAGFATYACGVAGFTTSAIMFAIAVAGLLGGPRRAAMLSRRPVHRLRSWAFGLTMLSAAVAAQAYHVLRDGSTWVNGAGVLLMGVGLVVTFWSGLEPFKHRSGDPGSTPTHH